MLLLTLLISQTQMYCGRSPRLFSCSTRRSRAPFVRQSKTLLDLNLCSGNNHINNPSIIMNVNCSTKVDHSLSDGRESRLCQQSRQVLNQRPTLHIQLRSFCLVPPPPALRSPYFSFPSPSGEMFNRKIGPGLRRPVTCFKSI